jgi:AcrR family transcriptional regulator
VPKETFLNLNQEKQEMVMRVAIAEISNKGFEKANIGTIAKNAGVAKGSMYQYFENKKELFMYSVQWAIKLIMEKYGTGITSATDINIFDFMLQNSRHIWVQMREERELIIFIQDVFLGKYSNLTDESMEYMLKVSDEYLLKQIQDGKRMGYIRKDIDDKILSLYLTGVSYKIKEHMMRKGRESGGDMIDDDYDTIEKDINAMVELMKNGMHA